MFIYKCHCFLNKQKRSTLISSGHTQGTVREASGLACWPQTTDRPGCGIALCGLQSSSVALGPYRTTCLDHWSEPCCTFHLSVSSGTCLGLLRAWLLHMVITCSTPSSLSSAVLLVRSGSSFSIYTNTSPSHTLKGLGGYLQHPIDVKCWILTKCAKISQGSLETRQ